MSEDTKVEEKKEETEEVKEPEVLTESQQQVKTFETVEDRVKANQAKLDEAKKTEETKVEDAKKLEEELKADETKEHPKVKKPAHEVIRELKKERNEVRTENAALKDTLSKLNERLEGIESKLASGEISKKQAIDDTGKVTDTLNEIEIPPELMPYKDFLFKVAETIADKKVAPILEDKIRTEQATWLNQQETHWNNMVEKYPEMFDNKVGEDGLRELKPNFDKEAMEMVDYVDISKPAGVDLIFSKLYAKIENTTVKKAEIDKQKEAVKQTKETRVESSVVNPVSTKPKSVEDIVKQNMKKAGMEVR